MKYRLCGKSVRGRFGFPSGVVATSVDITRWMYTHIPQLGFYTGKSTTIEPREGYSEEIVGQPSPRALWNAVGYTNPGLEETVRNFYELREALSQEVFLMPQIGESSAQRFQYCAEAFSKMGDAIDGIELNLSCPHAQQGGILIGSMPDTVHSIVSAVRAVTEKPIFVKLNAGVAAIKEIAAAAVSAGTDGITAINTLGGEYPELSNGYGGISGAPLFPITCETVKELTSTFSVPLIVMGGIYAADDIRTLLAIDASVFLGIGTALMGMSSESVAEYFQLLASDLNENSDSARTVTSNEILTNYIPVTVREVVDISESLRLIRFRESFKAGIGQFIFLKIGRKEAKPFSVADDTDGLELVVRKVGRFTSRCFELKRNDVVRIRGPYGKALTFPFETTVVFVGGGCGIAPLYHAATHHQGTKIFVIGAKTINELVYLDRMRAMGEVIYATEDGSGGYSGDVVVLFEQFLKEHRHGGLGDCIFFNCGPEMMLKKIDSLEKLCCPTHRIIHLVERVTKCGIGVCGSCSIPSGKRLCVDGPWFDAQEFLPGLYRGDVAGRKVFYEQ